MNCSHNCMMCRVWKYIKKHFKNFVIKTIIFFNMLSLMYWIVYIDYIISWQPYAIMAFNLLVLSLIGYATVNVTSDNARIVVNGEVYEILLIDDPMNMHDHLEIYLRFIGGQ